MFLKDAISEYLLAQQADGNSAATLSELCDTCEISNKGTMSRILGKLEKGGLITREGNARRLTPKGESALGGDK